MSSGNVDGVFADSDEMAVGAMRALGEWRLAVPGDIRIIGFDDLPIASYRPVSLTTVAQPIVPLAEAVAKLPARRMENKDAPIQVIRERARRAIRESCPLPDHASREKIIVTTQVHGGNTDFFSTEARKHGEEILEETKGERWTPGVPTLLPMPHVFVFSSPSLRGESYILQSAQNPENGHSCPFQTIIFQPRFTPIFTNRTG